VPIFGRAVHDCGNIGKHRMIELDDIVCQIKFVMMPLPKPGPNTNVSLQALLDIMNVLPAACATVDALLVVTVMATARPSGNLKPRETRAVR
jgi:hypothetical protein